MTSATLHRSHLISSISNCISTRMNVALKFKHSTIANNAIKSSKRKCLRMTAFRFFWLRSKSKNENENVRESERDIDSKSIHTIENVSASQRVVLTVYCVICVECSLQFHSSYQNVCMYRFWFLYRLSVSLDSN